MSPKKEKKHTQKVHRSTIRRTCATVLKPPASMVRDDCTAKLMTRIVVARNARKAESPQRTRNGANSAPNRHTWAGSKRTKVIDARGATWVEWNQSPYHDSDVAMYRTLSIYKASMVDPQRIVCELGTETNRPCGNMPPDNDGVVLAGAVRRDKSLILHHV